GGPQAVTVVMLRSEHDIPRAGGCESLRPGVRVEELCPELLCKIAVRCRGPVMAGMEVAIEVPIVAIHAGVVPLGIRAELLIIDPSPRRDGEDTPVDEDAELRIRVPGRQWPRVQFFPGQSGLLVIHSSLSIAVAAGCSAAPLEVRSDLRGPYFPDRLDYVGELWPRGQA